MRIGVGRLRSAHGERSRWRYHRGICTLHADGGTGDIHACGRQNDGSTGVTRRYNAGAL